MFAAVGAAIALGTYIALRRILLKGQKEEIIKKAELEAESIKKEKIFQAKEKFLQLKSEHEQYINEKNKQISDIENPLSTSRIQNSDARTRKLMPSERTSRIRLTSLPRRLRSTRSSRKRQ